MRILTIAHNHLWKHRPHGGEISTRIILEYLKDQGFEIYIIHNAPKDSGEFNGMRYWSIPKSELRRFCEDKIVQLRPQLLLSWSYEGIITEYLSQKYQIPYIYFVRFWHLFGKSPYINLLDKPIDREIINKYRPVFKGATILVANSKFTSNVIQRYYKCNSIISYPPVRPLRMIERSEKKYLTLINWSPIKGSKIIEELAKEMPKENFVGVVSESLFFYLVSCLSMLKKGRLKIIPYQKDIARVYSKTKILLCPSQSDEAFGRVALEALYLGIPVIAFRRGGLSEAVGDGGILLERGCPIQEWVEAIRGITANYQDFSKKAFSQSQKFNWQYEIEKIKKEILRSFL